MFRGFYQSFTSPLDIIGLLILGILFVVLFLIRQGRLERIHASGSSGLQLEKVLSASSTSQRSATSVGDIDRSWHTPPPLMKLSIWRRANGRLAAMMWIAFLTWCAFTGWGFWAQVRFMVPHAF